MRLLDPVQAVSRVALSLVLFWALGAELTARSAPPPALLLVAGSLCAMAIWLTLGIRVRAAALSALALWSAFLALGAPQSEQTAPFVAMVLLCLLLLPANRSANAPNRRWPGIV